MDLASTNREWWCVDFEFIRDGRGQSSVVCMVAVEAVSGREIRLWHDELSGMSQPPFPIDSSAVFVAYMATAEMSCFRALNWSMPALLLDLYPEFILHLNGLEVEGGKGLLSALAFFNLPSIAASEKDHWRERIIAGPPYSDAERAGILDYCASDCYALVRLLPHLLANP